MNGGKATISLSNLNLFTSKYLLFLQKKIPIKETRKRNFK